MSRSSTNAKALAGQKRHRRQWLTFVRMCRYGINNFSRNAWLTIAATAVMTITLVIIFITVAAQNILSDTTDVIGRRLPRSIFLKPDTTKEQAQPIVDQLSSLANVESVAYSSSEENRAQFAVDNKTDKDTLNALTEASNRIPAKLSINLKDVNNTSQLISFVNDNETLKKYIDPIRKPTFMGDRRAPTETIASWTQFAQKLGIIASIVFVSISSLIIFNTIRMAIFNRKEEIQMMKLIGAEKSFIRGPFVVEAIVYGFIAAVLATVLGAAIMYSSSESLKSYGVPMQGTVDMMTMYIGFILLGMILLGALIGTISSLLATRRYLKL